MTEAQDGMPTAERIRPKDVARITSLSVRKVQELAATGVIPGAAKLGGVWTFDPIALRAWIKREEQKVCRRTYTYEAVHTTDAISPTANSSVSAYERVIFGKPAFGSKPSAKKRRIKPTAPAS